MELCPLETVPAMGEAARETSEMLLLGNFRTMAKVILKSLVFVFVLIGAFTIVSTSHARCFCQCVDGRMVPVCESTSDIRPAACVPLFCPPTVPNVGMKNGSPVLKCEQRVLCDKFGRCRLREICR